MLNFWKSSGPVMALACAAIGCAPLVRAVELRADGYHVFPGDNPQDALELAKANPTNKHVFVHPGEYRPKAKRQALVWFNRAHDGISFIAIGQVTLTAANAELATKGSPSFPAVVNHVVYFGDGISSNTVMEGFRITGANHYVTEKFLSQIEPDTSIEKNSFFLTDGGAIKIFGRSCPVLRNFEMTDNYASPCAGAVSVQQQGHNEKPVRFENCIFRGNRAQVTGAALDLLEGSAAEVINCLFVGNVANTGPDVVAKRSGEPPFINSGALTVFQNSRVRVERCTFAANRNGVDDLAGNNSYIDCIFYGNDIDGGVLKAERYDLDLPRGGALRGCFFSGRVIDPKKSVRAEENQLNAPAPDFSADYIPRNLIYEKAGYRPVTSGERDRNGPEPGPNPKR